MRLSQIEPPQKLYFDIISQIDLERRKAAKIRIFFSGSLMLISFILMIPAFQYAVQEFSQSGFYQYVSLIFSDSNILLAYWQEFALSLAESLPVLSITVVLGIIFMILSSFRITAQNFKVVFN